MLFSGREKKGPCDIFLISAGFFCEVAGLAYSLYWDHCPSGLLGKCNCTHFQLFFLVSGPVRASISFSWFSSSHRRSSIPGIPFVHPESTRNLEHCLRLTDLGTFSFYCCPIALHYFGSDHTGDFLRLVASPENPREV